MRFPLLLAAFLAAPLHAANLDLNAFYRLRALSYSNLGLDTSNANNNNHSFLSNDARLGMTVRKILLETREGEDMTMDVGVLLHAVAVAGSSGPLASPFDRAASIYPDAGFRPFLENAFVAVHRFLGRPVDLTVGRQNFRLGSGLVLDDDGSGFTGANAVAALPWGGVKAQAFGFSANNLETGQHAGFFGGSIVVPSEGTWSLNGVYERKRGIEKVYGCSYTGMPGATGCQVSETKKYFATIRYQINYGPMVFDGEAALERGTGVPTGPRPSPTHILFAGDAQIFKAKWKQGLYRMGEGIGRLSVARGSGDDPGTGTMDEAFFPSRGHRFEGLERSGFGDFFGATPFDAFGGNYSSTTASGLREGASGIIAIGAGFTPPAYKGITLDIDYFLFHATRIKQGPRKLGSEWDFRVRIPIEDRFVISASAALFSVGPASNPLRGASKKYALEAYGRF